MGCRVQPSRVRRAGQPTFTPPADRGRHPGFDMGAVRAFRTGHARRAPLRDRCRCDLDAACARDRCRHDAGLGTSCSAHRWVCACSARHVARTLARSGARRGGVAASARARRSPVLHGWGCVGCATRRAGATTGVASVAERAAGPGARGHRAPRRSRCRGAHGTPWCRDRRFGRRVDDEIVNRTASRTSACSTPGLGRSCEPARRQRHPPRPSTG